MEVLEVDSEVVRAQPPRFRVMKPKELPLAPHPLQFRLSLYLRGFPVIKMGKHHTGAWKVIS